MYSQLYFDSYYYFKLHLN